VTGLDGDRLEVVGLSSEQVGEAAAAAGIVLHELRPSRRRSSEAFMRLTHDTVEFQARTAGRRSGGMSAAFAFRGRVTQGHVVRSEWTKLWSLRSTRWALLAACVTMAGLGILIAAVQMAHWNQLSPDDRGRSTRSTSRSEAGTSPSSPSACSACW